MCHPTPYGATAAHPCEKKVPDTQVARELFPFFLFERRRVLKASFGLNELPRDTEQMLQRVTAQDLQTREDRTEPEVLRQRVVSSNIGNPSILLSTTLAEPTATLASDSTSDVSRNFGVAFLRAGRAGSSPSRRAPSAAGEHAARLAPLRSSKRVRPPAQRRGARFSTLRWP